jgi:hypothetical protein
LPTERDGESGEGMPNFLEQVNRTVVSAEVLGEAIKMHAAMPAEDRPVEVRAIRLFELLDKKKLGRDRAALALAIDFRLTALARLHDKDVLRGWSMPGNEPGVEFIHADLVLAAAEEPVIEDAAGQVAFDPKSFRRRLLANAETRGRA